jgi:flagellin-like hook-associated protein FlgL
MPNAKITEVNTISEAIYPQVSAAISSSTLVDMSQFNKYCAVVSHGTATTASTFVVKVYESTASTWAGAVAVLLSTTTTSVATASTAVSTVDVKATDITEGKRYLGVYVTKVDTASSLSAVTIRSNDRYLG